MVVNRTRLSDSPLQYLRTKVITIPEIRESHYEILRLTILNQCNARYNLNPETFREERALFGINLTKFRLQML